MSRKETHDLKKRSIMEHCFDCYAKYGLTNAGIKDVALECGISVANIYLYFDNLDDLIVQATEYCMTMVEDDFMSIAPKSIDELEKFYNEAPYWAAKMHGAKFRLMYQIYTNPKYSDHGKRFFDGANKRYWEYASTLSEFVGILPDKLYPLIVIFVGACVHFALFEDDAYLQAQLQFLKHAILLAYDNKKQRQ